MACRYCSKSNSEVPRGSPALGKVYGRGEYQPEEVYKLQGDEARAGFINCFKKVQRYRTQLEQYTDIDEEGKAAIEKLLHQGTLQSFRGASYEQRPVYVVFEE